MTYKSKSRFIRLFVLTLVMFSCFMLNTPTAEASVRTNITSVKLCVNQKRTLKVLGTSKKATFKSNNRSVATISTSGVITAKKKGSCTITATVNAKKYTCKVTVYAQNAYVGTYKKVSGNVTQSITVKSLTGNKIKLKINQINNLSGTSSTSDWVTATLIWNKATFNYTVMPYERTCKGEVWFYPSKARLRVNGSSTKIEMNK